MNQSIMDKILEKSRQHEHNADSGAKVTAVVTADLSREVMEDLERLVPKETMSKAVSENQSNGLVQSSMGSSSAADGTAAKKAQLMAAKPARKLMESSIKLSVSSELKTLRKQENTYRRLGAKAVNKYNEIIAKIRSLRRLIESLAMLTYEQIKSVWLRVVHRIV